MSFFCEKCRRTIVDNYNKVKKPLRFRVQVNARPVRVVVSRYRNGQIRREQNWCNWCCDRYGVSRS